jgi:hypothetical protein
MPKRKEPELDPKEQFKRFQETAKEHVEDEKTLDKAFAKLRPAKPAPSKTSGRQGR